jgi:hypothetical protein
MINVSLRKDYLAGTFIVVANVESTGLPNEIWYPSPSDVVVIDDSVYIVS